MINWTLNKGKLLFLMLFTLLGLTVHELGAQTLNLQSGKMEFRAMNQSGIWTPWYSYDRDIKLNIMPEFQLLSVTDTVDILFSIKEAKDSTIYVGVDPRNIPVTITVTKLLDKYHILFSYDYFGLVYECKYVCTVVNTLSHG